MQKQLKKKLKTKNLLVTRGKNGAILIDDKKNELFMLEINTHPGMTETSLIPEQAKLFLAISVGAK